MNGNKPNCRSCLFWEESKNGFGECRKKTPVAAINPKTNDPYTRALFPSTRDSDWCGEFRAQKTDKPAGPASPDILEI